MVNFLKKKENPEEKRRAMFEKRYTELVRRLWDIRSTFEMTDDVKMIDALIYEENAVLCHLEALYKEARAAGISLGIYERTL